MKKILFSLSISAITVGAFAQIPAMQWEHSYGGSNVEAAKGICQTTDGGYIAVGTTESTDGDVSGLHGSSADFWVTKISATGVLQWEECLGGSQADNAACIVQTTDSGYAVAGFSTSNDGNVTGNHGGRDFWIVKLSSSGAIQWQKSLGGSSDEACTSMAQTSDGGFILTGYSTSDDGDVSGHKGPAGTFEQPDVWVVKIDDTGGIQWQNSFGGSSYDFGEAVKQTPDGGYIVACTTASTDGDITGGGLTGYPGSIIQYNYWVLKLSSAGAIQWHKLYSGDDNSEASSIAVTMDGGYIVNGYTRSTDEPGGMVQGKHGTDLSSDFWVVKIDDTGRLQWQKCLGTFADDFGTAIMQVPDSGYMVFGYIEGIGGPSGDVTSTMGGGDDYWLAKLNSSGALLWGQTYGGSNDDAGYSISAAVGGGFVLAGGSQSTDGEVTGNHGTQDFWIVKLDCVPDTALITQSGDTLSATAFGVTYQWTLNGSPIPGATNATYKAVANGSYTVIGSSGECAATSNAIAISGLGISSLHNQPAINIYPNPTTGDISITETGNVAIKIYNVVGQLIKEDNNSGNISIAEFPSGIYFICVFNEQGALLKREKIVKE